MDWSEYNAWNDRDEAMAELWVRDLVSYLRTLPVIRRGGRLLDYGCSFFDAGLRVSDLCAEVDGFDLDHVALAAAQQRAPKSRFFATEAAIPRAAYDVIVINSVLQYFPSEASVAAAFRTLGELLDPKSADATVVIADLIPKDYSAPRDALTSLAVSLKHGCLPAMLVHLYKAATKPTALQFQTFTREGISSLAARAGFKVKLLEQNLTPSKQRFSVVLQRG